MRCDFSSVGARPPRRKENNMLNKKAMAAFAAGATLLSSFAFAAPAMAAFSVADLAAADFKAPSASTLNGLDKYISIGHSSNGVLPRIHAFEEDDDDYAADLLGGGLSSNYYGPAFTASDLLGKGSASEGDADVSVDLSGADDLGFDDVDFDGLFDDIDFDDLGLDDVDFDLSDVEAPAAETPAPAAKAAPTAEAPAAETPAPAAKAALKAAPAVKNAENADLADADLSL